MSHHEFRHTLKLSHSLKKELCSPYELSLENLLDITEGSDSRRLNRDQFDSSMIRALDKSPRWVLWIRDSIWRKFKKRQAALGEHFYEVTNSRFVRILLEMKRRLAIPVPANLHLPHYPENSNEVDQGKGPIETSRPEESSIIISQYPDTSKLVLGDNLPPMYANADTPTSCNPLSPRMIIRNLTPPISEKDEPTKQANTTSDQELYIGNSRPLPNWLAKLIH